MFKPIVPFDFEDTIPKMESVMRTLLIATTNAHKVHEYRAMFAHLPYQLLSLDDIQLELDVEETGTTFQANSELKALAYAQASGLLSLADDSGLEIDALDGAPGVYSARFVRPDASYEERFEVIFARLRSLPMVQRTARFRCVITIAEPSGSMRSVDGTIEGLITDAPRGEHGFGYDPIFYVPTFAMTTAEMAPEQKNLISHRGLAANLARTLLEEWPLLPSSPE